VSMEPLSGPARLARLRSELPGAAQAATQFAVDNPVSVAVTIAGVVVAQRVAFNAVRPRTGLQGLALVLVMQVLTPWLLRQAIEHDVISFKLRDGDGGFVSARELLHAIAEQDFDGAPGPDPA
jgi:hypothetical protein